MGYTHYWVQYRDFTDAEWREIHWQATEVVKEHRKILCFEEDQPGRPPRVDADVIRFNGKNPDGYETFILTRKQGRVRQGERASFGFCKTARNPYDVAVVEVLKAAKSVAPDAIGLSSDGGIEVFGEDDMGD